MAQFASNRPKVLQKRLFSLEKCLMFRFKNSSQATLATHSFLLWRKEEAGEPEDFGVMINETGKRAVKTSGTMVT